MPITKYSGANLKKLKKDELIGHITDVYQFIDLFDFHKLTEENEKLKEVNEKLSKQLEFSIQARRKAGEAELLEKAALRNAYEELKEENEKLKEEISHKNKKFEASHIRRQKLKEENKELLIEIDDGITWGDGDRWIERRKLIDRLLK